MSIQQMLLSSSAIAPTKVGISNTDNDINTGANTTYTFTSKSVGAANGTREVYVCIWLFSGVSATVSSVTIGGVGATSVTSSFAASNVGCLIYKAPLASGTTATVVVNFSTTIAACAISVYRVINHNTTPHATATDNTLSSNALSASLAIPANGGAISCCQGLSSGSFAVTWSNITERYDTIGGASTNGFSSASKEVVSSETPTISATITATASFCSMCAVSFAPL